MAGKKKKISTSFIIITISAAVLAIVCTITYTQIFKTYTVLVPAAGKPKIKAFSQISDEKLFETVHLSKSAVEALPALVTSFKDLNGKIPSSDLIPGLPIAKNILLTKEEVASTTVTQGGREIELYLKNEFCLGGNVETGDKVDLYFIFSESRTKTTYVLPVKALLQLRNVRKEEKGIRVKIQITDTDSERYLMQQYLSETNKGTFVITKPGFEPTEYMGNLTNYTKFMDTIDSNYRLMLEKEMKH